MLVIVSQPRLPWTLAEGQPPDTISPMDGRGLPIPRPMLNRLRGSVAATTLTAAVAAAPLAGCFTLDMPNPNFAHSSDDVWAEWHRMRGDPRPLQRPVVVLNGYRGTVLRGLNLGADLAKLTSQNRRDFLVVSYPLATDIPSVARRVIEEVNRRWPSDHPAHTVEVDVVGFSMGGLVARYAAAPADVTGFDRHLHVNQLYTLSTPHRGARSAILGIDRAVQQMTAESVFLADLDECRHECSYEIVPYAQTNDWIVGARNAAPPGQEPIWTAGTAAFSHFTITTNRRVLVDIARRMRGEGGLATPSEPPTH